MLTRSAGMDTARDCDFRREPELRGAASLGGHALSAKVIEDEGLRLATSPPPSKPCLGSGECADGQIPIRLPIDLVQWRQFSGDGIRSCISGNVDRASETLPRL
jgi:hypothetical protein